MKYPRNINVRLTDEMMNTVEDLAERSGETKADVVRMAIEIVSSADQVIVPLSMKERLFIEGICNEVGCQPTQAVKMVLLSYHTLMSSPLWKIVKPVDKILEEIRDEQRGTG